MTFTFCHIKAFTMTINQKQCIFTCPLRWSCQWWGTNQMCPWTWHSWAQVSSLNLEPETITSSVKEPKSHPLPIWQASHSPYRKHIYIQAQDSLLWREEAKIWKPLGKKKEPGLTGTTPVHHYNCPMRRHHHPHCGWWQGLRKKSWLLKVTPDRRKREAEIPTQAWDLDSKAYVSSLTFTL